MHAILSDVHANLEALEAVLRDAAQFSIEATYCLGDTVGYGPNPRECLDLVAQFDVVLRGNVDDLIDPGGSNTTATSLAASRRMLRWTRAEIMAPTPTTKDGLQRTNFLGSLKASHQDGLRLLVHGSP